MNIHQIIEEINLENGSNHKMSVLKKHQDNALLAQVLQMTYDRVEFTYGVTNPQIEKFEELSELTESSLEYALDRLEGVICARALTGHAALQYVANLLGNLPQDDRELVRKIINRDLRINLGRTSINKVWKGLITKPVYMRCDIFSVDKELKELDKKGNKKIKKGTARNINYPAPLQLKADGTYREFIVNGDKVESNSRSGESYEYPKIFEELSNCASGVYFGELTVRGISDRAEANGLINSDNPPHDDIIFQTWDFVSHEEYSRAGLKDKKNPCTETYESRWNKLKEIIAGSDLKNVELIPCVIVYNLKQATEQTSEWMRQGFEGAVLKEFSGVFKDGTPNYQLKMKIKFSIEVRVKGYIEGKAGTKREKTFGSIMYETDDGMIKGSVSGFTDKQLEEINSNRGAYLDKIFEIEANDITQSRGSTTYALSHPRWTEFRNDRTTTDTLERAFELLESAKLFEV